MRIAFYAPLKPPDHPVPSGDRQIARLLMAALTRQGHEVELASRLRAHQPNPDEGRFAALRKAAASEVQRLLGRWTGPAPEARPDLWFTYHLFYKAPDLIGPPVAEALGIPYALAEASYAPRRDREGWRAAQDHVVQAARRADVIFCLSREDRDGLSPLVEAGRLADLPPFIDPGPPLARPARRPDETPVLAAVAMMRPGIKARSYAALAEALAHILHAPWRLVLVGDGPARAEVEGAFARLPAERLSWRGQVAPEEVRAILLDADLYVWPGAGDYLAYLEAQSVGLPVVAERRRGAAAVIRDGETGILVPEGDPAAFAATVLRVLGDSAIRARMARAAHRFVHEERSLARAALALDTALSAVLRRRGAAPG